MSEPIHLFNNPIVGLTSGVSGDMSSSINSLATNLDTVASYSIQAIFTGTPSGTLQLQASNDNPASGSIPDPNSWTVIDNSVRGISAAGTYTINYEFPAYSWVRLQYVRTGGSGTMTSARINAKRR